MHAFSFLRNSLFLKLNLTHSKKAGATLGLPLNEASSHLKHGSPESDASQGTGTGSYSERRERHQLLKDTKRTATAWSKTGSR